MARGYTIKLTGFDKLKAKFQELPEHITEQVEAAMEDAAKVFVRNAKRDAPKDTGFLTGQISYVKVGPLHFQIVSGSFQAGFIEFGTKTFYTPIPGFEEEAASIRGIKGGSIEQFKINIQQWVNRKGIRFAGMTPEQTAMTIMYSILKNGIRAQPYFFKQVPLAEQQLTADIRAIVID